MQLVKEETDRQTETENEREGLWVAAVRGLRLLEYEYGGWCGIGYSYFHPEHIIHP